MPFLTRKWEWLSLEPTAKQRVPTECDQTTIAERNDIQKNAWVSDDPDPKWAM